MLCDFLSNQSQSNLWGRLTPVQCWRLLFSVLWKALVLHGPKFPYPLTPSMLTTLNAWNTGLHWETQVSSSISPHTPLWNNLTLHHFYALPDPQAWAKYRIKSLYQILANGELKPFTGFRSYSNVPSHYIFRPLQVAHALNTQFPTGPPQLACSDLEALLLMDLLTKPDSMLYTHLLMVALPDLFSLQQKWLSDIPDLDDENWSDMWETPGFHRRPTDTI